MTYRGPTSQLRGRSRYPQSPATNTQKREEDLAINFLPFFLSSFDPKTGPGMKMGSCTAKRSTDLGGKVLGGAAERGRGGAKRDLLLAQPKVRNL